MLKPALALTLYFPLLGATLYAQQPLDANLLINPDFETGVGGWTSTRGSFTVKPYGSAVALSLPVSVAINGGAQFLECSNAVDNTGGSAEAYGVLEQLFDLTGNALDVDAGNLYVEMSGFFGGGAGTNGRTFLRASYRNASGGSLSVPYVDPTLPIIDSTGRNGESLVLGVRHRYPVPPFTRSLKIELFAYRGYNGSGPTNAWADNLDARLLLQTTTAALPLDTEIFDLTTFEGPRVLHPQVFNGARVTRGAFAHILYGSSTSPNLATSNAIAGGNQLLECSYAFDNTGGSAEAYGVLEQLFDLEGNANDIDSGSLYVTMSGYFGGATGTNGRSILRASYFNATGGSLSIPFVDPSLPTWTQTVRNNESTILAAARTFPIPPLTRRMRIELIAYKGNNGSGGSHAWADNVSVKLTHLPFIQVPQLGAELIVNGGFETGQVLDPASNVGWYVYSGTFQAQPYGLPNLPTPAVSQQLGGGTYLMRATGSATSGVIYQWFYLDAHSALIDSSLLSVHVQADLGGFGSENDSCYLQATFYSEYGATLGQSQIGPVTSVDRGNVTTLLRRQGSFPIPVGTRRLNISVVFQRNTGSTNEAFLDNVHCSLVPSGLAVQHPGTGDDFTIGTGINGIPSGGPGQDLKDAHFHDILSLEVRSPQGTYNWSPLLLGCNVFPTATSVPPFGLPGLHLNPVIPGFFFLLDGMTSSGPFGPALVMPTGNLMSFVVPAGLTGNSMLLQAVVLSPRAGNGLYATTDAHQIRFQ